MIKTAAGQVLEAPVNLAPERIHEIQLPEPIIAAALKEMGAEAKDAMLANAALREALKEVLSWHDYTDDMHKPVEVRAAYMRARATLAQPADGGK